MGCGCRKGGGVKGAQSDLRKFAFLSPRQLRLLKQQEEAEKAKEQSNSEGSE